MSGTEVDLRGGNAAGVNELLARAAASPSAARDDLTIAIDDFFLPDHARLDERTRAALAALLQALVETFEGELRGRAARLLNARGEGTLSDALLDPGDSVLPRLARAGLLRDRELMGELIARVRQDALAGALPMAAPEEPDRPSLINRYVQHPDRVLAAAAMAVLVAENRRRTGLESGPLQHSDLPAELHHRLLWWVAAALRERVASIAADGLGKLDRALSDAALRSLTAYDEGERLEAAALRFAAAIDPQPLEVPQMLVEALGDRQLVLFIALVAHAVGVDYAIVRDMVLDPAGDRLWVALRAIDVPRQAIAQIGFALGEADPRRDLEGFADRIGTIAAVEPGAARDALAALRLDPAYRAALAALERAGMP